MGAIPIVNENDTVSTDEIEFINTFGDNDTLSALVAALVDADMLILLSDIDGLFTDDPHLNPEPNLSTWWRRSMTGLWKWARQVPEAVWEPEAWLPNFPLPGSPPVQERIWSSPTEEISM